MKKVFLFVFICAVVIAAPSALYAQGGCANSPENPTAILGVVGSAGFFVMARARFKGRRKP